MSSNESEFTDAQRLAAERQAESGTFNPDNPAAQELAEEQADDDDATTQQDTGGAIYPGGGGTGEDPQGTGSDTDGGDGGSADYSDVEPGDDTSDIGGDDPIGAPPGGGTSPSGPEVDDPEPEAQESGLPDDGDDTIYPGGGGTGDDPQGTGSDIGTQEDTTTTQQDGVGGQDVGTPIATEIETGTTTTDLAGTRFVSQADEVSRQARDFEQQVVEQTGADPGDVSIALVERDGETVFRPRYTDEYRREQAAEQATVRTRENPFGSGGQTPQQPTPQFDPSDITFEGDTPQLSDEAQRDFAASQYQSQGIDVESDDLVVGDAGVQLSEDAQQRLESEAEQQREAQIASELGVPASTIDEGVDYNIRQPTGAGGSPFGSGGQSPQEGGVVLTPEGREFAIESRAIEQGEIQVSVPEADLPGTDRTIGGGERTVDIERQRQLQFDDEGRLTGVQQPGTTEAEVEAAEARIASAVPVPFVGEAAGEFAFASREAVQGIGGAFGDLGAAVYEGALRPAAEVTGDVVDVGVQTAQFASPTSSEFLSPEAGADVVEAGVDITRGEQQEVGQTSLSEGVSQKLATGGAGIARAGIELPQTLATGTEVAGEAGAFAVQNPLEESAVAAGSTAVNVGEQLAVQAINQPIMTAGALGGSGAVFRASRAIGPRTNVATRAAIQPGEELLGYGGYGVTRRVAGEGAADRAFPQQEPLIFSEEAVIRTGQRVGGGIRGIGQRARGFSRGDITPSPRQAELIERGRPTAETGDVFGEGDAIAGARSEPLGSPTGDILEATTTAETRRRTPIEAESGEQQVPIETGEADAGLPLFEDIQEAGGTRPFVRGEDLPSRPTLDFDEFLAEERGQVPMGRTRSRTRPELETEQTPEIQDFDQLEVSRQAELESRRQLQSDIDPLGRTEGPQERMREAQQPFEVEAERERGVTRTELFTDTDARPSLATDTVQSPLAEQGLAQQPAMDLGLETEQEQRGDLRLDLETETEQETETESEIEQEIRRETETETETELEFEIESRREFDRERDVDEDDDLPIAGGLGVAEAFYADFRDPLTGETLETERTDTGRRVFDL